MNDENSASNKLPVGSWAFSQEHREPVRILQSQTIWSHMSYLVWRPNQEAVAWINADQLSPLDQPRPKTFDHLLYRVTAARVVEGLSEDVLLAPLEAGVIPLPHQLVALSKAMSGDRVRYWLASAVGLGQTIEADAVIRELNLQLLTDSRLTDCGFRILIKASAELIKDGIPRITGGLRNPEDKLARRRKTFKGPKTFAC